MDWGAGPGLAQWAARPELAHFPAGWKAACAGKSAQIVMSCASCGTAELFGEKVDKGPDAGRAVAARDRQRVDRKRFRHMAVHQQWNEGALAHGARDHEIRQPRDTEPGYCHVQ